MGENIQLLNDTTSNGCYTSIKNEDVQNPIRKSRVWYLPLIGITLGGISGVTMSYVSVCVKLLSDINPGEVTSIRFLFILLFSMPLIIYEGETVLCKEGLSLIVLRGVFDALSIYCRYQSVLTLPLVDANVIIFSVPVFVAILARIILKEHFSWMSGVSMIMTILGLLLIVRLPLQGSHFSKRLDCIGIVYGFAALFFNSFVYIIVRKMKQFTFPVVMFYQGLIGFPVGLALAFVDGKFNIPDPEKDQQWLLVAIGVLSFAGEVFKLKALRLENAGNVSIARSGIDIIFSVFWQISVFHDVPDNSSISGAICVLIGSVILNLSTWVKSLPEKSKVKKYLWCFMK